MVARLLEAWFALTIGLEVSKPMRSYGTVAIAGLH